MPKLNMTLLFRFVALTFVATLVSHAAARETENVVLVTMDGLRWQELFGGADERLMQDIGADERVRVKQRYNADTPEARRDALMPFFWSKIAAEGQVFGDPAQGSAVKVTNGKDFSYPGYNELLCGFADPAVDSNEKVYNENVTVLEWLNQKPLFRGRVAAYGSWDVFPFILNDRRSRVYVNAGWAPLEYGDKATVAELNAIARDLPHNWAGVRYDAITFRGALEHLKAEKPRVLYLSLGETDDWAHAGRYELYLDAAAVADDQLRRLWETLQSMDEYRGKTSLVITTDHGRGDGPQGWKNHSVDIEGSNRMWIAVIGPDTPGRGVLKDVEATQSQVAATVAKLLGEDFTTHDSRVAKALELGE
jgi:hypothetical protein